jgi:hypothetical protein
MRRAFVPMLLAILSLPAGTGLAAEGPPPCQAACATAIPLPVGEVHSESRGGRWGASGSACPWLEVQRHSAESIDRARSRRTPFRRRMPSSASHR